MKLFVRFQVNASLLACEANSEGKGYMGHAEKDIMVPLEEFTNKPRSITMLNNLGVWFDVCDSDERTYAVRAVAINTKEAFETLKEMGMENI